MEELFYNEQDKFWIKKADDIWNMAINYIEIKDGFLPIRNFKYDVARTQLNKFREGIIKLTIYFVSGIKGKEIRRVIPVVNNDSINLELFKKKYDELYNAYVEDKIKTKEYNENIEIRLNNSLIIEKHIANKLGISLNRVNFYRIRTRKFIEINFTDEELKEIIKEENKS
jgi:hypothetical protein